ncbi:hypothetical protein GBF38_006842 [Nibea albiflora]|uniref:Uncharacterized protein n=1 Tax=Nibea albiflora TaxID=240163 RepID=A0ACB7EG97_NIBAL|nr:hypothetical protein GBF38_006842 [Nibea albiflora]
MRAAALNRGSQNNCLYFIGSDAAGLVASVLGFLISLRGWDMLLKALWEEIGPLSACVLTAAPVLLDTTCRATGSQESAALIVQVTEVTQPL